jgi:hypothetical protein
MAEKVSACKVQIKPIVSPTSGELSDKVLRKCNFCKKECECFASQSQIIDRLCGPKNFYCSFCLRHGFNNKGNRNVFILSFRSIFSYFYLQNYCSSILIKKIWISEIEDYIESHKIVGLINPLFFYDDETMLWFIDFSKVGNSKKKIPLDEILKTIINILVCFNFRENAIGMNLSDLYLKYKKGVEEFYQKRHIPKDDRMLIPNLENTGAAHLKSHNAEKTKNFIFRDLCMKKN